MDRVTQAIILRAAASGESDVLVTLLSPELGKFEALMKGVKKPKAKLKAYAQPFCFGEYALSGARRPIVTGCSPVDLFYELAARTPAYLAAHLALEAAGRATDYQAPAPEVFVLLLRALRALAYTAAPPAAVAAKFMADLLPALGYAQTYRVCARCGGRVDAPHYAASAGGITCGACAAGRRLAPRTYRDLQTLALAEWDDLETTELADPARLVRLLGGNLETVLETKLRSLDGAAGGLQEEYQR